MEVADCHLMRMHAIGIDVWDKTTDSCSGEQAVTGTGCIPSGWKCKLIFVVRTDWVLCPTFRYTVGFMGRGLVGVKDLPARLVLCDCFAVDENSMA